MNKIIPRKFKSVRKVRLIFVYGFTVIMGKIIGEDKAWRILGNISRNRRIKWIEKNLKDLRFEGNLIDQAYNIFYEEYFGFSEKDMEIVERNEDRIITRWRHFCPSLEACKFLRLDPREVCKRSNERAVNDFMKSISPKLKFTRNIEKTRPHSEYCEEMIEVIK